MFGVFEMPMDVNNIDVTVNTNALFGLINFLMENEENLEDIFEFYDQEIRQIINDVTDLIVWAVKSEVIIKRPDLSLTYYPSEYNFYWFVSRIGNYLNRFENIPFPEIERTKNQINDLLENT
ncbi:hypothetical protein PPERSA_02703 [Pseudocohnilembus persalinus]|uniref:Uncharacterized protein n=1 Tax=Pseudocohnilembus persalinus TaxID=266149 RepID=A0A0V0R5T2_PSEPJ|nr:hypothetical protein PPERSA_02703 [Pseudocohnilembus persalinus]|eukprot:KRX09831.1 hypothetical protein PPERSA_02703 [Pseudocohnilembus persalinus]